MRNPSIACKSCFRNVASPVSDKTPRRFGKQVKTEKFPVSASLQRIVAVLHLRPGKHHGSRGDSIPTPFVSQFRVPCQCEQDQMVRQTRDKKIPGHIADAAHQDAFCPKAQCSGVLKIERQRDLPGIFRDDFCRNGSVTVNGRTFSLPLAKTMGKGAFFAPLEILLPPVILQEKRPLSYPFPTRRDSLPAPHFTTGICGSTEHHFSAGCLTASGKSRAFSPNRCLSEKCL